MKYVLFYMQDEFEMARRSQAELDRIVEAKVRVGQALHAQGKHVGGYRLWPTATATRITPTRDGFVAVEGPFAETKEVVGGLDVIECASREEALEWAGRYAVADGVTVEVRPVWERCLCHGSYACSSRL